MRNIALAIVVLAVTIPAMGDVTITIDNVGNKVTVGYDCNDGEVVRAFALKIDVNNGAFVVGSAASAVDPNVADYYIYPGSISFTVVGPNTVIDQFGTPVAEQDANGGILEMASLYSENDPDPNRWDPPADSNVLATFYVDCNMGQGTITLSEDSKRGGVVLEDPNEAFTLNLPDPLGICTECLIVGQNIGCVDITQAMYDLWVTLGRPDCWCYPYHCMGDTNGDDKITAQDVIGTDGQGPPIYDGWLDSWNYAYHPCADINNDGKITAQDVIGSDGQGPPIYDGWLDGWNYGP